MLFRYTLFSFSNCLLGIDNPVAMCNAIPDYVYTSCKSGHVSSSPTSPTLHIAPWWEWQEHKPNCSDSTFCPLCFNDIQPGVFYSHKKKMKKAVMIKMKPPAASIIVITRSLGFKQSILDTKRYCHGRTKYWPHPGTDLRYTRERSKP